MNAPSRFIILLSVIACHAKFVGGTEECPVACDSSAGQFCGTDGTCHDFNCEAWYQYGPDEFTGRNRVQAMPDLSCDPWWDNRVLRNAVVYGCQQYTPGSTPMEGEGLAFGFNEKCIARLSPLLVFECYSLRESTDLAGFEQQAESAVINCPAGSSLTEPQYLYQTIYGWTSDILGVTQTDIVVSGINGTDVLDEAKAKQFTMTALLTIVGTTEAPMPLLSMSPSEAPTEKATSSSVRTSPRNGHLTADAVAAIVSIVAASWSLI